MKVALLRPLAAALEPALRGLAPAPAWIVLDDLYQEAQRLRESEVELLIVPAEATDSALRGALRLLGGLMPELRRVLATVPDGELAARRLAEELGAELLLLPPSRQQLARLVHGRGPGERPSAELFADLARGLCDAINNPLLFTSGHLQLLELDLDPQRDRAHLEQLQAARGGLDRIAAFTATLRLLERTHATDRREEPVALREAVTEALAAAQVGDRLSWYPPEDDRPFAVRGDRQLIAEGLRRFCACGPLLAGRGGKAALLLEEDAEGHRLRLSLDPASEDRPWNLPRTFEPFYIHRVLRSGEQALDLFFVEAMVLGHGGRATARRRADGAVLIDLVLPRLDEARPQDAEAEPE